MKVHDGTAAILMICRSNLCDRPEALLVLESLPSEDEFMACFKKGADLLAKFKNNPGKDVKKALMDAIRASRDLIQAALGKLEAAKVLLGKSKPPEADHYATLGVKPGCPQEDIKTAYRNLSRMCHPDKTDKAESVQNASKLWFQKVQQAYDVLGDPDKRAKYDEAAGHPPAACSTCSSSASAVLRKGDRVRLSGLQQAVALNGREAEVQQDAGADGRVQVALILDSQIKQLSVAVANATKL